MRVYMMTDLEAVAGVVSFEQQTYDTGKHHDQAKRLLTAEVNAAVQGCLDAGATDVLVIDGHGPGGIWFEDLHHEAKLYHGRPIPSARTLIELARDFDVAMMIGQHAMAGVAQGNLQHTYNSKSVDYMKVNGKLIGEIAGFSLGMGSIGIPMIFLSGDDSAIDEVRELIPVVGAAQIKQSISRNTAISVSATKAREIIREGATAAIKQHRANPIAPLKWPGPYTVECRYFHTDAADAKANAGWQRVDPQTVSRTRDDIVEALWM